MTAHSIHTSKQTFELLSPSFCAGFSKEHPEMRMTSIIGQLRWWHRALHGVGVSEYDYFGGIHADKISGLKVKAVTSYFKFTLEELANNAENKELFIIPHKKNNQQVNGFKTQAIPKGNKYTLSWTPQLHPSFISKPTAKLLEQTIQAWMLLGTIGRRSTRAMGSVWPVQFKPSIEDFTQVINSLGLHKNIHWAVLSYTSDDNPDLPHIAGETIHNLNKDDYSGNPLGYTKGKQRKSSPLRFKIGAFKEGNRIIAIFDNRDERGGDLLSLENAIDAMSSPLKEMLSNSSLYANTSCPVAKLLAPKFEFTSIDKYKKQLIQWKEDQENDLIALFINSTQEDKYKGLRQQQWYKDLPSPQYE